MFTAWQQICEERQPGFNAERGYVAPPPVEGAPLRWGSAFEDAIVELASAKQGRRISCREDFWITDGSDPKVWETSLINLHLPVPESHYITCHIDGRYCDDQNGVFLALHEGKTTSLFNFWENWGTPGTDRIPQGYQVQVQHQMLCTGAAEAIVSVLVFPRRVDEWEAEGLSIAREIIGMSGSWFICRTDTGRYGEEEHYTTIVPCRDWARVIAEMGLFHQYPVAASSTLQKTLVDAYRHFWDHYVLPEREPELGTYDDWRRAFPAPKGTVVATEQVERWAAEFHALGDEISPRGRLGKRREELKLLLLDYMRKADRAIDDESREATILRDQTGRKLASFNGKVFR